MMEQGSWFHVVSHHWVWRVSFCRFWLRWGYQGTIIFFFKLVNIMSGAWWVQTQLSKDEEYMVCNLFFSKTISLGCKWIIRNFQISVLIKMGWHFYLYYFCKSNKKLEISHFCIHPRAFFHLLFQNRIVINLRISQFSISNQAHMSECLFCLNGKLGGVNPLNIEITRMNNSNTKLCKNLPKKLVDFRRNVYFAAFHFVFRLFP